MRSPLVLVVDDEETALDRCSSVLAQNGYAVVPARTIEGALAVWSQYHLTIEAALFRAGMPGLSCLYLLEAQQQPWAAKTLSAEAIASLKEQRDRYHLFWRPFDLTIFLELAGNLSVNRASVAAYA